MMASTTQRRWGGRGFLGGLLCLLLLLSPGPHEPRAWAEDETSDLLEPPPGFEGSPEELDAFFSLLSQRLIRARELAEAVLAKDPSSYIAHYVMGEVEHDAEANFPRAVFHMEQARRLFEAEHGEAPSESQPWRWHTRILLSLAFAYGELEQHEKKLSLLAHYNKLYDPDRLAERAWPLMKLRRFREARAAAKEGLGTGDPRQREIAYNSLCAIEFEAGDDAASYDACKRAMDNAREMGVDLDPADLMNFAEASRSVFKLEEAERIDREATEENTAWYGNPWSELAELYLREGRLAEALFALRQIPPYRLARPPHVRESDRNENRRALSSFFVVLGRADDALRVTKKAIVAPDRRGHNSRDPAQDRSIAALLDRAAHLLKAERLREDAATRGWYARFWAWGEAQLERAYAWQSARGAVRALGHDEKLSGSFQIGSAQAAVMPPWLAGDLIHATSAGPAWAALERARAGDKRAQAGAYYDAFAGEAAWLSGNEEQAEPLLSRALAALPQAEQLLRARVQAVLADLRRERGAYETAHRDYERTLQLDPSILRRLSLSLPVVVQVSGDEAAELVRDGLDRSPRFDVGERGLSVEGRVDRAGGEICLVGVSGGKLACGAARAGANESADALAFRLLSEFHGRAFSPHIDLSQADANSLDGSNLRGNAQDLDSLFGEPALGD